VRLIGTLNKHGLVVVATILNIFIIFPLNLAYWAAFLYDYSVGADLSWAIFVLPISIVWLFSITAFLVSFVVNTLKRVLCL